MPERGFDTGFWTDPFVQELPQEAKTLYIYLWTNSHCNPAGLYEIALKTISFETGLPQQNLPGLFTQLKKKVIWQQDENLVWVKNFIKRQSKSSKFLAAAAKSLMLISNNGLVKEVLDYNLQKHRIPIPYRYYMDRISIPSDLSCSDLSYSVSQKGDRVKGKGGKSQRKRVPDPRIKQILDVIKAHIGYPDKTHIDPIPNYGEEGQHIETMLKRGFTPEEVISFWEKKIDARGGEFISAHWVNIDIGKKVYQGERRERGEKPKGVPGQQGLTEEERRRYNME